MVQGTTHNVNGYSCFVYDFFPNNYINGVKGYIVKDSNIYVKVQDENIRICLNPENRKHEPISLEDAVYTEIRRVP